MSCLIWYRDGTFFLVDKPFHQLFTINGFLKKDKVEMTQVPLCFVEMTRRTIADYTAVYASMRAIVSQEFQHPNNILGVKKVVSDFERALFRAVRKELPEVAYFGCSFHWSQAVMKQVKRLRLAPGYRKDPSLKRSTQQLMELCYLPGETIRCVFQYLLRDADPKLQDVFD